MKICVYLRLSAVNLYTWYLVLVSSVNQGIGIFLGSKATLSFQSGSDFFQRTSPRIKNTPPTNSSPTACHPTVLPAGGRTGTGIVGVDSGEDG